MVYQLKELQGYSWDIEPVYSRRHKSYVSNAIYTFDIETTTLYYINGKWLTWYKGIPTKGIEKCSLCYLWQFGINNDVFMGRTLEEFRTFLEALVLRVHIPFTIWVHNLGYECQHLRNVIRDFEVFARQPRQPMYFDCKDIGIEGVRFRDSLILTQYSLDKCSKLYAPVEYQKLTGSIDYNELRTPHSKLTPEVLAYAENDIHALYYTVLHYRKQYRYIDSIPLTHTGIVRRNLTKYLRANSPDYFRQVRACVPYPAEFRGQQQAFTGGSVIGNPCYSGRTVHNVASNDIASSYPAHLVLFGEYPVTRFRIQRAIKSVEGLNVANKCHCMLVTFKGLKGILNVHYIPHARLLTVSRGVYDNGKLVCCAGATLWLTEIDLEIINRVYTYDSIELNEVWEADKGYINDEYRRFIIDCYRQKTTLKGIPEKKDEYDDYKTTINALYGIFVTSIVTPDISYEGRDWHTADINLSDKLRELKSKRNNINIYSQGVYCTALARRSLWRIIVELDKLGVFVYSDTDSHKYINRLSLAKEIRGVFEAFNDDMLVRHKIVAQQLNIDPSELAPVDIKGIAHPLGFSEYEGLFEDFCQRGAKKYCYKDNDGLHITVAGLGKKKALSEGTPLKSVQDFEQDLYFDEEHSGRLTATYNDSQPPITIDGHTYYYRYGLALTPTTYTLSDGGEYSEYLEKLKGLRV